MEVEHGDLASLQTPIRRTCCCGGRTGVRVEGEIVRDLTLSASGLLERTKIGGPSVFPPQPEGVYDFTQRKKSWKVERRRGPLPARACTRSSTAARPTRC